MLDRPIHAPPRPHRLPWSALGRLIRLDNQTGTLLLLWPTLWALVLAERGFPAPRLVLIFTAGAFLMRSAGVILNDLADQSYDRNVSRTKGRPLASGELSRTYAFSLLGLLLCSAGWLVLMLNDLVLKLAPVALLLTALYPFAKRVIHIPQAVLGIAFGWGTLMAWAAVHDRIEAPAWCLFGATIAWAIAYDTIYALQDREDDRLIGVKSAALMFGSQVWLAVGTAFGIMLTLLGTAGWLGQSGWLFYGSLLGVGLFFSAQVRRLRAPIDPAEAFRMFRAHVWAGAAVLTGILADFLM